MRKSILLALLALGGGISAQESSDILKEQLENDKKQVQSELDIYLSQTSQLSHSDDNSKHSIIENSLRNYTIENQKNIAFFLNGYPYFLQSTDTDQISNSNADALQEGTITGLNQSFNGEGINVSIFDGGRIYEHHIAFGGINSSRVTNKERDSIEYSSHATGVASMVGGEEREVFYQATGESAGNIKGIATKVTFDSYSFSGSTLKGENEEKNVFQKLKSSLANISNHSYGIQTGWDTIRLSNGSIWIWRGKYNPNTYDSDALSGVYGSQDRSYDDIIYEYPSMIAVKSAGNSFGDGPNANDTRTKAYIHNGQIRIFGNNDILPESNCSRGYDCIGFGSLAKNIIIVGSTEKIMSNNKKYSQSSDVVKSSFSSAGPRDDGAIKPDIAGVGSDILYASTSSTGSNSIAINSGTSFSAPQVTGIIALWMEIYKSLFSNKLLNAASAKTLLIHSALEAGNNPGPDAWFGWGFADAKKGAELLVDKSNNKIIFEDKILENNKTNEILLQSDGSEPLKVTISWIDPSPKDFSNNTQATENGSRSRLVNDLDLRVINIETKEIYYPWKLDINNPMAAANKGDNTVDNVEQVLIEKPKTGVYKVEVSHKGNLVNNDNSPKIAPQTYSIIATGYSKIVSNNDASALESQLYVYPTLLTNSNNIVNITYTRNIDSVFVYDMSGRLLKSETVNGLSHSLDFSSYIKGVYIVKIKLTSGSEPIVRKVMKR